SAIIRGASGCTRFIADANTALDPRLICNHNLGPVSRLTGSGKFEARTSHRHCEGLRLSAANILRRDLRRVPAVAQAMRGRLDIRLGSNSAIWRYGGLVRRATESRHMEAGRRCRLSADSVAKGC